MQAGADRFSAGGDRRTGVKELRQRKTTCSRADSNLFLAKPCIISELSVRSRPGKKHGEKYQRSSKAPGNDLTTRESMYSDLVVCGGFF